MQKKGISPLIATVLLIGFSVALAAVVITWGLDYVKGTTADVGQKTEEALKCATQLDFEITNMDCVAGTVTIQNNGVLDITNITFRLVAGAGDITPEGRDGIASLGVRQYTGFALAGVSRIEVIAWIQGTNQGAILCKDAVEEYTANC